MSHSLLSRLSRLSRLSHVGRRGLIALLAALLVVAGLSATAWASGSGDGSEGPVATDQAGHLIIWSSSPNTQVDPDVVVPEQYKDTLFTAVSWTPTGYVVAQKADGALVGWGRTAYSDIWDAIPAGLSDVKMLAITNHSAFAVTQDGDLVSWGNGSDGLLSVPESA